MPATVVYAHDTRFCGDGSAPADDEATKRPRRGGRRTVQ